MQKLINLTIAPIAIISGFIAVTAVINYIALPVFIIAAIILINNNKEVV